MTILVSPLSHVPRLVSTRRPERIVSLLDPGATFPTPGVAYLEKHLRLPVHDIPAPVVGMVAPNASHMDTLLAFLAGWKREAPILIHCHAGFSRSAAAAFITACLHNPESDVLEIARALRRASPLARPNLGLVRLADAAMGRNGRMSEAVNEICRRWPVSDRMENDPFEMPGNFRVAPARSMAEGPPPR